MSTAAIADAKTAVVIAALEEVASGGSHSDELVEALASYHEACGEPESALRLRTEHGLIE